MRKIVLSFELDSMTYKEYDAIIKELNAEGKLYNDERPSHVAFDKDGKWCVVDVWESEAAMQEFVSTTLAPIFLKLGYPIPQPRIYPVHNFLGTKVEESISA